MMEECNDTDEHAGNAEKSKWVVRMELNSDVMLDKNITMEDVNFAIRSSYGSEVNCVYSDYNADKLVFRIRMNEVSKACSKGWKRERQRYSLLINLTRSTKLRKFQDETHE